MKIKTHCYWKSALQHYLSTECQKCGKINIKLRPYRCHRLSTSCSEECDSDCGGADSMISKYWKKISNNPEKKCKISVVGVGQVGITICAFLLQQRLTNDLVLMDKRKDWVEAEALDLLHASAVLGSPKIQVCGDGSKTKDSKYIIITAGVRPAGKSRLAIRQDTANILKEIVPILVKGSPKATYVVISNPADVMAWVTQQLSKIPPERCISSGCYLDTLRFQYYIAQRLKVPTNMIRGYVIGEHGDTSVPVWSSVSVGGVPLTRLAPKIGTCDDPDNWAELQKIVATSASLVSKVKGYTNWAIALSVVDIIRAMESNEPRILPLCSDMKDFNGIKDSVYLSLPCRISENGITHVVELPLTDAEKEALHKSACTLVEAQKSIDLS